MSAPASSFLGNVGSGPWSTAVDAAGNVYTANFSSDTITRITSTGVVSTFATGFNAPRSIAIDDSGNLYVTNFYGGNVSKVTST